MCKKRHINNSLLGMEKQKKEKVNKKVDCVTGIRIENGCSPFTDI